VTAGYLDPTRQFDFKVYLSDASGTPLPAGSSFDFTGSVLSGSGASPPDDSVPLTLVAENTGDTYLPFGLKHGQQIAIEGIVADGQIRIVQEGAPLYTTSFTDSEGEPGAGTVGSGITTDMRVLAGPRSFDFTNLRSEVIPVGVDTGNVGAFLSLVHFALTLFACIGGTRLLTSHLMRKARAQSTWGGRDK
jgi:hypothetical protein